MTVMMMMSSSTCGKKENFDLKGPNNNNNNIKHAWPNEVSDRLKGEETNFLCPVSLTRRLRVEKIEGGLMVAGVVIAANCQIILPIFGFLFLLIGSVLTAASYRGPGEDEEPAHYAERIAFTGNSRILGPACMVIGFLMLIASFILCILSHRARRRDQTVGFHCPVHGDFYPLSPLTSSKTLELIERNSGKCTFCWPSRKRAGVGAVSSVGPPQCPHSQVSSTRSSVASSPHSQQQCPTPLPFLVNSSAAPSVLTSASSNIVHHHHHHHQQQLPAEHHQSFGSIRSLTVGREIASFPLSRTPSPPPLTLNNAQKIDEQNLVNEAEFEIVPVHRQGPRKSVSIVIPDDLKG